MLCLCLYCWVTAHGRPQKVRLMVYFILHANDHVRCDNPEETSLVTKEGDNEQAKESASNILADRAVERDQVPEQRR
jgi:hypothetical protein